MTMKPDQERVRGLLTDTVTLLCRNGLQYSKELRVQGLLGITLDNDDVFVVHINEVFDELIGGKLAGVSPAETDAAIASGDSSEQNERDSTKSRKGVPHKHGIQRTSSPMLHGSSKRKASLKSTSPMMRVKKEEVDDDIVIMDSDTNNLPTDAIPGMSDLSGDGDREAMRMSYGGPVEDEAPPPAKRRANHTHSNQTETFTETNTSASGAPFITGIMRNIKDNDTEGTADVLGNASLDGSQLSSIGPLQDGQVLFDGAGAGCSNWDETQEQDEDGQEQTPGSQDSCMKLPLGEPGPATIWPNSAVTPVDLQHTSPTMVPLPEPAWNSNGSWVRIPGTFEKRRVLYRRDSKCPDKPFRCQYPGCDKAFYRGPERNRHQKLKHGRVFSPEQTFSLGGNIGGDFNVNARLGDAGQGEDLNANHLGMDHMKSRVDPDEGRDSQANASLLGVPVVINEVSRGSAHSDT